MHSCIVYSTRASFGVVKRNEIRAKKRPTRSWPGPRGQAYLLSCKDGVIVLPACVCTVHLSDQHTRAWRQMFVHVPQCRQPWTILVDPFGFLTPRLQIYASYIGRSNYLLFCTFERLICVDLVASTLDGGLWRHCNWIDPPKNVRSIERCHRGAWHDRLE